jgi:hypothetical protein
MPDAPAWYPDASDVAALVWARTVDASGQMGEFTEDTRPTAGQVDALIGFVAGEVSGAVGPDLPAVLHDQARRCVTLGTAAMVERSFFPEQQSQTGEDRTAAVSYAAMYETALQRLMDAQRSYAASASAGGGRGLGTMRVRTLAEAEGELP